MAAFGIKPLRQKKADLKHEADSILAATSGGIFTDAQRARLDAIKNELQGVETRIISVEQEMDRERNDLSSIAACDRDKFCMASPSGPKYAQMFPGEPLSNSGFASREEFYRTMHSGLFDQRLFATNMNESTPAEGGFLVPTEYSADLLDAALEGEIIRPRAHVVPMLSATKKVAGFDGLDNSTGAPYGFQSIWMQEAGTGQIKVGKVRQIQLTAQKLGLFTQVSNELVADGMTFEEALGKKMIAATSWSLDSAFFTGDGVGQPLGVLNDPALVTVTKEGSQSANTINTTNVLKIFSRMHPASIPNSVWVINSTAIPQAMALMIGSPSLTMLLQLGPDGNFRMLSRPVIFSEKVPELGTKGDIGLYDFSQYCIGIRKEVVLEKSQHVGWQTDESGYRCILRVDGQGLWGKPFTPLHGDTTSWAVTLETRGA